MQDGGDDEKGKFMKWPRAFVLWLILLDPSLLGMQSPQATWLAVLRSDGLLQPVGKFDGSEWFRPDSPPSWFAIRAMSDRWYCWPPSENSSSELSIGEPVYFQRFEGETSWGFITDYCPRFVDRNYVPFPKAGFALDSHANGTKFVALDTLSEDWQKLGPQILSLFAELEDKALSEDPAKYGWLTNSVPKNQEERERFPITIQHLSRTKTTMGNEHIYRFEAVRYYPVGGGLSMIAELQGWAATSGNKAVVMEQEFAFDDSDGKQLPAALRPLGVFELKNRIFLLVEVTPYEGEYYMIVEFVGNKIITRLEPGH